jgi:hypothetical protein
VINDDTKNDSSTAVAVPLLDIPALRSCYEKATQGPYCIESCGEKGDGSNIVGVAFGPDDLDAKTPLTGWLEEADKDGNFIEYYRDEEVAEFEHRNPNCHRDAEFLMTAYNNFPELLRRAERYEALVEALQAVKADLFAKGYAALATQEKIDAALKTASPNGTEG